MGRKKNKGRKKAIKHNKYKDHNLSMIDGHHRQGKKLTSPLMTLPNQVFNSWLDNALPDVLWATILAAHLERDDYLDLFRQTVSAGREGIENYKDSFISHPALSQLSDSDFDSLTAPLTAREDVKNLLSSLLLFESLPDRKHWARHLPEPAPETHWNVIGKSVFDSFDHQSEKATDCRWFKVVYIGSMGRLSVPPEMRDEIINFPNVGDMRKVRPSIRALEMTFRPPHLYADLNLPADWNNDFWEECRSKTKCTYLPPTEPEFETPRLTMNVFATVYGQVLEHFENTESGWDVDPRHDGAFGLTLYGLYLCMEISDKGKAFRAEGRILLRTLVECYLTLRYLSQKDDPTIWKQYRNYGAGQSKLSFLKHITSDSVPDYVRIEELEMHANADMWMEFQDIDLGAWSNKNLRKMAEEVGVKDVYDRYYDWSSGFVHGNWSAIRDTVFEMCGNPLHRFHRVASLPRINMNDSIADAGKLANLILDELNHLYPSFKPRIKAEKK